MLVSGLGHGGMCTAGPDEKLPPPMPTHRSFGLDLAGYTAGGSALAEVLHADGHGEYQARVYRQHPFATTAQGRDHLTSVVEDERDALARLLRLGRVLVDIPIDLQGLPSPPKPVFVWQLTARAVDFAYGGLRPLADRIGAPVARFLNLLAGLDRDDHLRETYPAGSFSCMEQSWKYKRQTIEWDGDRWVGGSLAEIARSLRLVAAAPIELTLTDDDVDALVCALTGAVPPNAVLQGEDLNADMRTRLAAKLRHADVGHIQNLRAPDNYCLLRCLPEVDTHVQLCDWPPPE